MGHLKFKKVEIDGSLNTFIEKMKEVGFLHDANHQIRPTYQMTGKFMGEDVKIFIATIQGKVNAVNVLLDLGYEENWDFLLNKYQYYVELFSTKYKSIEHREEFIKDYEGFDEDYEDDNVDDYDIGEALSDDCCKYYHIFSADNGIIKISIGYWCINIEYVDKENTESGEKKKREIELEDI